MFVTRSRWWLLWHGALVLLATVVLGGLFTSGFADDVPDPAGTATGDKTTTTCAAGNPFVAK